MKTISELQNEIRSIREGLTKMNERLSVLDDALLEFKDSGKENSQYAHIYNLAESMPIILHPIVKAEQKCKSLYFGILLMIAILEDSISEHQLLFLQRMIMTDTERTQIDYYMGNLGKIQPDNIIFRLSDNCLEKYYEYLLLDMMIISKLGKKCSMKSFGVVADIASILGKKRENLVEICAVANVILKQEYNDKLFVGKDILSINKRFGFYLNEIEQWGLVVKEANKNYDAEEEQRRQLIRELWYACD